MAYGNDVRMVRCDNTWLNANFVTGISEITKKDEEAWDNGKKTIISTTYSFKVYVINLDGFWTFSRKDNKKELIKVRNRFIRRLNQIKAPAPPDKLPDVN